jgi:hypothetical protein
MPDEGWSRAHSTIQSRCPIGGELRTMRDAGRRRESGGGGVKACSLFRFDRRNQANLSSVASLVVDLPCALFAPSCEVNPFWVKTNPTRMQEIESNFQMSFVRGHRVLE